MPAPKQKKLTQEQLDEMNRVAAEQDELAAGVVTPGDVRIMELMEQLEGAPDATVRIYRQGKGGYRDIILIDEMPINDFRPIMLRDEPYNGGDFRVHLLKAGEFAGNVLLRVESRPKPAAQVAAQDGTGVLLQQIADMNRRSDERMTQLLQSMQANAKPPQTRADMLAEMETMARIFKPVAPDPATLARGDPANDAFTLAQKLVGMIDKARDDRPAAVDGDVSENAVLLNLAREFFTTLRAAKANGGAPALAHKPAQELQQHEQPAAPNGDGSEVDTMGETMKYFLGVLVNQASLDGNIETYANLILDHAGEAKAFEFLAAPDWFAKLTAMNADVAKYPEWFNELREAIVTMLRESDDAALAEKAKAIRLTTDDAPVNVAQVESPKPN